MKDNLYKLMVEIEQLQLVSAAEIRLHESSPLCIANNEIDTRSFCNRLFNEHDFEILFKQKIFGKN